MNEIIVALITGGVTLAGTLSKVRAPSLIRLQ